MINEYAKELKRYQTHIKKCVKYWVPVMGLNTWAERDCVFVAGSSRENPGALGMASTDWQHMAFTLTFFLGAMAENQLEDDRVEAVVIHELCHVLVSEISPSQWAGPEGVTAEERVITYLTESFLRLKYREGKV